MNSQTHPMLCRGVRGATTVESDNREQILTATRQLLALMIRMALRAESPFSRLVIAGSALTIFLYVFINVAMVTGLVPVVGVPLPLISYGGTSMVTIMTGIGLAVSARVHGREQVRRTAMGAFF